MVVGDLPGEGLETEVLVIGGGPGGYAAAFRAADLGLDVTLVSDEEQLGGVCLLRGCIPSKTLLSLAELVFTAEEASDMGIRFGQPEIDFEGLRAWKNEVVDRMVAGLQALAKGRGVRRVQARARLESATQAALENKTDQGSISFDQAILATGSRPIALPGTEFGGRVMDSATALELADIPERLLVVGGGYVGLELGTVYAALGSRITLVEMTDRLLPGTDRDLVEPLTERVGNLFEAVHLETKVAELRDTDEAVEVILDGEVEEPEQTFDHVLVAIGRAPNSDDLGLDATSVRVDDDDYILVDEKRRTDEPNIYAIGDVVGGSMLAHEAIHEGRVAAEVAAGEPSAYDVRAVPAVVYTDPQIAWCGLSEMEAEEAGRQIEVTRFPWRASGRAVSMGHTDGMTKLVVDPQTRRVLGVGIVGRQAEALIAEGVLAVEMGALADDLALSVHPHPTLTETLGEAAELLLGGATHVGPKQRR